MMKIHCVTHKKWEQNLLDKLLGWIEPNEITGIVKLCLTDADSRQLISAKILARVFGLIIQRLAEKQTIFLLFPYDTKQIKNELSHLKIDPEVDGRIKIEITSQNYSLLFHVLEVSAFTTFYAWIGEMKSALNQQIFSFQNSNATHLAVVFSLYDESIELLSNIISTESIIDIVREVGEEEGIESLYKGGNKSPHSII